jgi:hypothetical protein
MSRLSDLYQAIETLRKEGLMINEDLEKQVSELEEEIIKKEILPIITETIAPALEPVKRELVLVVDHVPGAPLSVHISRKRNFAAVITDAKEITPDPQVEHTTSTINNPSTSIADRTGLRITFADGRVIQERKALETLRQFVILVGVMNVRALGLKCCKVPLVSNTLDDRYQYTQKPVGNGWYLMTHSSTKEKKRQIEKIAKALNIDVKVEII